MKVRAEAYQEMRVDGGQDNLTPGGLTNPGRDFSERFAVKIQTKDQVNQTRKNNHLLTNAKANSGIDVR